MISELFKIKYPIIQGGMIWCSGWKLASAVSNSGGLGLIGAGSMYPNVLHEHIIKCKKATSKPFGVNVPLLYPQTDEIIDLIIKENIRIVFTSAGDPSKYTDKLKSKGIKVAHVVSNLRFALKAEKVGVDAIVAEGFEAGGHNGIEETTTMVLIPTIKAKVGVPIIAAGGIASGESMYSAMALGADGVQIGSLFASSHESSAHDNFKNAIIDASDGGTYLTLKNVVPVRLLRNEFFQRIQSAILEGKDKVTLINILGKGRAKMGMFEGNLIEGELEVGQISSTIDEKKTVSHIFSDLILQFNKTKDKMDKIGRI
ncbi:MAG: nitronate monooxygenase [Bacteroidales bacterium]|nr:nitronate monooxygenase [Bacteroidales bacterium]